MSLEKLQKSRLSASGGDRLNRVVVYAGQTVRLNFCRKDPSPYVELII